MSNDVSAPDSGSALTGLLDAVGPRLRALRQQRAATQGQLSQTTGISVSTLSRLESGQRRPTLDLLIPLAQALQVPLDELVDAPPTGDPRVHARPVKRHGVTVLPLTRRPGGIQSYKMIIPVNWAEAPEQDVHQGYGWFYVLSGQLRLQLVDRDLLLSAGEVVEFDTHLPHRFSNPGPHPVELLSLCGQQGERLNVRARATR